MIDSDIIRYIENPGLLEKANLDELKKLIVDFPFFQTAHILYLKALKSQHHENFEQELSKSSSFISDRDLLFQILNNEFEYVEEEELIPEIENQPTEKASDSKLLKNKNVRRKINNSVEGMGENISETISSQLEFTSVKPIQNLEYPSEIYFIDEEREGNNNIIIIDADPNGAIQFKKKKDILDFDEVEGSKKEENKELSKEVDDSFELIESDDFEKNDTGKKKERSEFFDINSYADSEVMQKEDDLITRFIHENPRIKPTETNEENVDVSEESAKENSNLLSETLAKVYIKQGLFEKAIQSYERLCLKYPEKSAYFASQIKIVEEKINKQ